MHSWVPIPRFHFHTFVPASYRDSNLFSAFVACVVFSFKHAILDKVGGFTHALLSFLRVHFHTFGSASYRDSHIFIAFFACSVF